MKDYGVYLAGLFFLCAIAAHVVVTAKVVQSVQPTQEPLQAKWDWLDAYPDSMIKEIRATDHTYKVYELSELDIPPLINDRCKGDLWRWACTQEEFGQYVERKIWQDIEGSPQPMEWHEMIEIVLDEKGKVEQIHTLLRKEKGCEVCYDLLERAILAMPRWIPGVKDGKSVKTRIVMPFSSFSFS